MAVQFCGKCGMGIKEGDVFCTGCGQPVGERRPAGDNTASRAPAPVETGPAQAPEQAPPVAPAGPVEPGPAIATAPQVAAAPESAIPSAPAPTPEGGSTQKSPKQLLLGLLCGIVAASLLFGLLAATGVFGGRGGKTEGSGYATPEAAVEAYIKAFSGGDIDAMLATFAVETYVENLDFEAQLERMGAYTTSMTPKLPAANSLAKGISTESRRGAIANIVFYQYIMAFSPDIEFGVPVRLGEGGEYSAREWIDKLANEGHGAALSSIKLEGFIEIPELERMLGESIADSYYSEAHENNMEARREILGAEEIRPLVAEVSVNGAAYLLFMDTAQYGGKWYNQDVVGNLGTLVGISYGTGGFVPVGQWEYW